MASLPSLLSALCILLLSGAGRTAHVHRTTATRNANFVATRMNKDNELETRLSYGGIDAIETVVPSLGEHGLFFRKATNGKQIVTSIYQDEGLLADCDVSRDEGDLSKFYDNFLGVNSWSSESATVTANDTLRTIDGDIDDEYKPIINFNQLKTECRELHRYLRQQAKLKKKAAQQALQHDDDSWPLDDDEDDADTGADTDDATATATNERQKRAMFIYPGTNWCGTGNTAKTYHDLGENSATDKCCRAHDHCPYVIDGFSSKYNHLNVRFHTISHCQCDETFRQCLRRAGSSVANMVGSLFFNVVSTTCFVLKPEKVCQQRSWWGKCTDYNKQYMAELQEPDEY